MLKRIAAREASPTKRSVCLLENCNCTAVTERIDLSLWQVLSIACKSKEGAIKPAIPTGFYYLDQEIGGFRPGQLVVMAARTSVGKTAFSYQLARHAAEQGYRSLYISIEMPNDEIAARELAGSSRYRYQQILDGFDDTERQPVLEYATALSNTPLDIWSPSAPTLERICATIRCEVATKATKLAVVDYVSLIRHDRSKKDHWQLIGEITRAFKSLAKDLQIPIMLLAQLDRSMEKSEKTSGKGSGKDDNTMRRPTLLT